MNRLFLSLGPIVYADLLKMSRRKRWYVLRVVLGLFLLFLIYEAYETAYFTRSNVFARVYSHAQMQMIANRLMTQLIICQGVAIFFLAPTLTAGAIAEEKQRKTLHYLLTSQMSSFAIVFGKLFSRFFVLALPVAICLPVMVMLGLLGGVEPLMLLSGYGLILSTSLFAATLAILMSTLARTGRDALFLTFVAIVAWLGFPVLFEAIMLGQKDPWPQRYKDWFEPINQHLILTSPMVVAQGPSSPIVRAMFGGPWGLAQAMISMALHQLAGIVLFLGLAVWQLRPAFRRQDGAPTKGRTKFTRKIRTKLRDWWPRKPPGDNAMLWKETAGLPGSTALHLVSIITVIVTLLCAYDSLKVQVPLAWEELWKHGYFDSSGYSRHQLGIYMRMINTALFCVVSLLLAALSSTAISREREDDTWISLVSTPLDGREILRAKLIGSVWAIRWLLVAIAAVWIFSVAIGATHPLGVVISAAQLTIFSAFILGLGTLVSLKVQTTMRAIGLTLGLLITMCVIMPLLISSVSQRPGITLAITCFPFLFSCGMIDSFDLKRVTSALFGSRDIDAYDWVRDAIAVVTIGTIMFAVASVVLLKLSYSMFDRLLDRPRRPGVNGPSYEHFTDASAVPKAAETATSPAGPA